jgi:hypothetical protein
VVLVTNHRLSHDTACLQITAQGSAVTLTCTLGLHLSETPLFFLLPLQGLRGNLDVALQYMEAWLRGLGCVPIHNLMEDAATAEISRWVPRSLGSSSREDPPTACIPLLNPRAIMMWGSDGTFISPLMLCALGP